MFVVAISRGSESASKSLREYLSRELEVPVLLRETVFEEADKYSIHETGFSDISFIDRAPSVFERRYYRNKHYLLAFQVALFELIMKGSCIYEGHLGHYLLKGLPFILRTRAILSEENRIKLYMKSNNVSYEIASNYVSLVDDRRRHWSEFLYGMNLEDPKYYDLVINLDYMSVHTAVEIILTALKQAEFNSNDDSMKLMKNLYLESKASLYLYLEPATRGIEVDINADYHNGSLIVKGISSVMDSDKSEQLIRGVLSKLEKVKVIKFIDSDHK
ncbi:MAG: cytidylate kinase family protein [Candidatus Kapabacteria bacterium]|nr:cytidylate kinase family protein [Candidatus Kapabacteria bacterium]